MAAPNFSVTDVVGRGVNFAKASWRQVLGVLLLATVTAALAAGYGYAGRDGPAGILSLINGLVTFMATAALLRLAFRQDQPNRPDFQIGRQGVQWGNPETQLLLVALLLMFWAILAASAVLFVIFLLALFLGLSGAMAGLSASDPEALAEQLGPGVAGGLGLLIIGLLVGLIWLSVRLALYAPATVAAGRVRLFSTMRFTKGRFWKLLGALLLASLPTILAGVVASGVVEALGEPVADDEDTKVVDLPAGLLLGLFTGAVVSLVQLPLITGVYAELYRRLGPGVPVEPERGSA